MATLSITIPDPIKDRVLLGFTAASGYQEEVDDGTGTMIPNPQTRAQYAKEVLKALVKSRVVAYESEIAGVSAREAAQQTAESEIDIQD